MFSNLSLMKTKNSNIEYIAFDINSVFSSVAIIAIIVRSLRFLCFQYLSNGWFVFYFLHENRFLAAVLVLMLQS